MGARQMTRVPLGFPCGCEADDKGSPVGARQMTRVPLWVRGR